MSRTIAEWKTLLTQRRDLSEAEWSELRNDSRTGVQKLLQSYLRQQEKAIKEAQRIEKMWQNERLLWQQGMKYVAGVDEAGRGPLAGPVVAAAVILPSDFDATGLNDSKQLSIETRNHLRERIESQAISIGIGVVDVDKIDRINILQATYQAMRIALQQVEPVPEYILADAVTIPHVSVPQKGIIKGDALSHSIAAASIIAKTTRDECMIELAKKYPQYGFEKHMGYGTPDHLVALRTHGVTPIHRKTFAPVREILET